MDAKLTVLYVVPPVRNVVPLYRSCLTRIVFGGCMSLVVMFTVMTPVVDVVGGLLSTVHVSILLFHEGDRTVELVNVNVVMLVVDENVSWGGKVGVISPY